MNKGCLFDSLYDTLPFFPGLKKVTDDMKTHKNPELRQSSVVKASDVKPKATSSGPKFGAAAATAAKPPKLEFQSNKWIVVSIWSERERQGGVGLNGMSIDHLE